MYEYNTLKHIINNKETAKSVDRTGTSQSLAGVTQKLSRIWLHATLLKNYQIIRKLNKIKFIIIIFMLKYVVFK